MSTDAIIVVSVVDEGDTVIIRGTPMDARDDGALLTFAFHAKGDEGGIERAETASRLRSGAAVVIEYESVTAGWNVARRLSPL